MCRWAAYLGPPILLEDVVLQPRHSLIQQSHRAVESKTEVNADGFGIAWYGEHDQPGLYRDILPAWSDYNLRNLVHHVRSRLFLAHVRASTGTETSRPNCHPFVHGNWSFMHNGAVGQFDTIRRNLDTALSDDLYQSRTGTTDSEAMFLTALQLGLDRDPRSAIADTLSRIVALQRDAGAEPYIRFTAAFSDGQALYAVRFATDDHPPSLYYETSAEGTVATLASEPTEADGQGWTKIPPNSFVVLADGGLDVQPFTIG